MIQFKDFVPQQRTPPGFFSRADYEEFEATVERANHWIGSANVRVINVETVVLPNIHNAGEDGSTDPDLRAAGEVSTNWHQIVRVWYEGPQR